MSESTSAHRVGAAAMRVGLIISTLALVGCQNANPVDTVAGWFGDDEPNDPSAVARDAFDVYDADKRRRAVNRLSTADWGGEPPYLKTYRLLLDDPDATVRAAAVSALGRHGTLEDVPRVIARLNEDDAKIVRWEAARALQKMHDERAIDPLIKSLSDDPDMDVRQAAAMALGQYPHRRVFSALVGALNDEDFGVAYAAEQSLQTLTGKDFGDRSEPWWQWAKGNPSLFDDQRTYFYPAYEKPPGLISRMAFWTEDEPVERRRPRTPKPMRAPATPDDAAPAPALRQSDETDEPTKPTAAPSPAKPGRPADPKRPPEPAEPVEAGQPQAPEVEPSPSDPADNAEEASEQPAGEDAPAPSPPPAPTPRHPLGASG